MIACCGKENDIVLFCRLLSSYLKTLVDHLIEELNCKAIEYTFTIDYLFSIVLQYTNELNFTV
jgi:hypothetical protein